MGSNTVQAWIFFRPYFHCCLSSFHQCKDRFHIHFLNIFIYALPSIHHFTGLLQTNIMTSSQLACQLDQLVDHCTGIAKAMGSNPVQAWISFQASFSLLPKYYSLLPRSFSYSYLISLSWKHHLTDKKQQKVKENAWL